MLYNSLNLEVAKIADKSDRRPEIAGVLFKSDRTVATDGFRLLEISTPADVKAEEFPKTREGGAMLGCKPFLVSAKSLRDIKIPKNNRNLPIVNNVAIKHIDEKRVEFLTTDMETANITMARRVEGKFPEYEVLFPTGKPVAEVLLNGDYLSELVGIMAKLGGATKQVRLKFYAPNKPIVMEAGNENQRSRGLIMPIKE
jgi:DNA polymerase III sliding clamp (beta) subunit (PCNA family)